MNRKLVFITGYFGAPIREEADRLASCKGWRVLDLDRAIEAADGRSIARLCMMNGEHAYRNAEYEQVRKLCDEQEHGLGSQTVGRVEENSRPAPGTEPAAAELSQSEPPVATPSQPDGSNAAGLVVACGDGILYDEDTRGLILRHELVIVGEDQPLHELWERAAEDTETYHAFMRFGTDAEKRAAFEEHHRRQKELFAAIRKENR